MTIKVLGLSLYGNMAASTRYRLQQYTNSFRESGIDLKIHHLLGDEYLKKSFNNLSKPWGRVLTSYLTRTLELLDKSSYDGIILYGELFPLVPAFAEKLVLTKPYIYDFDDAFYMKYSHGSLSLAESFLGSKFDKIMAGAAAITAGNHYLASYAKLHNPKTYYLPTVVDTTRYFPLARPVNEIFTIGWIGSPSTSVYLNQLIEPLSKLGSEFPVRLVVVGAVAQTIPNVDVVNISWSESTEIELIRGFDVGVMPLTNDLWAKGKCAFKLIQYMACGIPVVASSVGANIDLVQRDCGFLVDTTDDWVHALRILYENSFLRSKISNAARLRIEHSYSLQMTSPFFVKLVKETFSKI